MRAGWAVSISMSIGGFGNVVGDRSVTPLPLFPTLPSDHEIPAVLMYCSDGGCKRSRDDAYSGLQTRNVVKQLWDHDPERARDLLQEYVQDPNRSDGKDAGEPVSLTFTVSTAAGGVELATAYEGFYEDVGFDVTVEPEEHATVVADTLGDNFQVLVGLAVGDSRSPLGEFEFYFGEPGEVLTNFTNFHDETVVDIIEQLRTAADVDEQADLTERMGLHLAEQVPFQWIGSELSLIAADEDVRGLRSWVFPDGTLGNGSLPVSRSGDRPGSTSSEPAAEESATPGPVTGAWRRAGRFRLRMCPTS